MIEEIQQPEIQVLGIPLYAANIRSATAMVIENCQDESASNYCISATGAHGLVMAKKDKRFEQVLRSFFANLPDGMPGVWIGRLKGAQRMERCYGPDFFKSVMTHSKNLPINHFFCGGNPGVAQELRALVKDKFGNNNVVGTFCPPFLPVMEYDFKSIANHINECSANVVWIGLSTPKQELFASSLASFTKVNFIITVGAAFDFHTGNVRQAPSLFQSAGLEWLFRLIIEPKRLYKRYLKIVPLFILYNLKEFFYFCTRKESN